MEAVARLFPGLQRSKVSVWGDVWAVLPPNDGGSIRSRWRFAIDLPNAKIPSL